ncbi:hypothetical protein [Pseudomonas tremae]|uniref:hypothetical protein n=1 Tax=Pseudomonas tremae TaxID=200454 RepID=UPI001F2A7300|nr:hypothetical protein [Pseudomonas tremae]MCF5806298.1 hypothetical protein [Pseudomonas tremae]MCF5807358.1 hypothetical protein [Pseudomonas tremae]
MKNRRIILIMPCCATDAFDAFHDHRVRSQWDTLLSHASVEGGGSHPYVGAITVNAGRGWKRLFAMRTRFVNYRPGQVAAAVLVEPMGCFQWWAASMRHRDIDAASSELIYTFILRLRPKWLGRVLDPLVNRLFEWETRNRFAAMAVYLRARA